MINIKAELLAGTTPRALSEMLESQHRRKIETEIAEGKWCCPKCRAPMKLKTDHCILYCGHSNCQGDSDAS